MRISILLLCALITAGLLACNSNETLLSKNPQPSSKTATPASSPADNVRRITAAELHRLWDKNEVFIIDTRLEPAYKQEHIRGAILAPPGTLVSRINEIPRDKMIVAYCT